jgi:hypothetical protein
MGGGVGLTPFDLSLRSALCRCASVLGIALLQWQTVAQTRNSVTKTLTKSVQKSYKIKPGHKTRLNFLTKLRVHLIFTKGCKKREEEAAGYTCHLPQQII